MKYKIYCFITIVLLGLKANAQQFISKGTIEFEVTTNVKKTMRNSGWDEQLKDQIPTFKFAYYNYTFADNKSIYKFDHYDEKKPKVPEWIGGGSEDENVWYYDFNTGQVNIQKVLYGSTLNLKDSINKIQWKLTNESRLIAGFNCRKAVGKIMDSVYVFAFYTDEITISGGPCTVNGLPGMILGLTIPRLYVSMIATKLSVTDVNETIIKPVTAKKYLTPKELKTKIDEITRDWNTDDDKDSKNEKDQFYWQVLL